MTYIKKHKVLLGILVLIVGGIGYLSSGEEPSPFESVEVKKGNVIQEVSVTGRVNSDSEVSLAFEKSGRVSSVPRPVGTHVAAGDILVRIDSSEISPLREQARANLSVELANLASLQKGNRAEDIAVSQAQVESAKSSLEQARMGVFDKISAGYTVSDDAVHNISDQFFRNPRSRDPEISFPITDSKLAIELPQDKIVLESILSDWKDDSLTWSNSSEAEAPIEVTKTRLNTIKLFLDKLAVAINALTPSSSLSQATIDGWKLDVSGARTSVNSAISGVLAVSERYRAEVQALRVAENQLALKVAGPTPEAIAAQEARIASVRATIASYDAQIAKTMLTAPFAGVITKQDAKLGQTVSPGVAVVVLMSDSKWKIEANVPEVDVSKLKIGDKARVSFDAYGTDVPFTATVTEVDPAETIVGGVSTYKVTLRLDENDDRVRSGMTANIDISTDKRENVLYIPARAVTTKDTEKTVRVVDAGGLTAHSVTVTLGLRGSEGNIEVLSGLSVGEKVVIFEKK